MVLSPHVLMTENIRNRQEEVFDAIRKRKACNYVYCITLPSCESNLLDIHPYREIYNRKEYDRPFVILGLSENRSGAVSLVTEMAAKVAKTLVNPEDFRTDFIKLRDSLVMGQEIIFSLSSDVSELEESSAGRNRR